MYVTQETSHRLQKNVPLNRKLGNGQETKGTMMEIFQAWIRLLTNEDPAGNSDKGARCLLKNYSCKLPDCWCCWQGPYDSHDKSGPKGQQPWSNLDADASEKKVIKNFLTCIPGGELTLFIKRKIFQQIYLKKLDLVDGLKTRIFYLAFTYNSVMHQWHSDTMQSVANPSNTWN